jgi:Uncharacterised methyltransferase family (DUF6094)
MARLASVVKQGYFPAPPEAVAGILRHLKIPDPPPGSQPRTGDLHILDPCAGEAKALVQIAEGLGVSKGHAFAVELNVRRAAVIAESHPEVRLLGPCSFEATRISRQSLSMVFLNPPFDDEFGGGGREEVTFLRRSVDLLVPGGILVLVCPVGQVYGRWEMCELIDTWFEDVELYLFPDDFRRFNECVVFGRRRKAGLPEAQVRTQGVLTVRDIRYCSAAPIDRLARLGEPQFHRWDGGWPDAGSRKADLEVWELPFSPGPKRFEKTALTEEELEFELAHSPLYDSLRRRTLSPLKRPPLSLNKGHTSLLLLTGMLDGYVPSDPPHVVRGYTGKAEKLHRTERYETPSGDTVHKQVFSESPMPIVRAVWPDGTIRTFSDQVGNDEAQFDDQQPELEDE